MSFFGHLLLSLRRGILLSDVLLSVKDLSDLFNLLVLLSLEVFSLNGVSLLSFGGIHSRLCRTAGDLGRRDISLLGLDECSGVAAMGEFEGLLGGADLVMRGGLGGGLQGVLFVLVLVEEGVEFVGEFSGFGDALGWWALVFGRHGQGLAGGGAELVVDDLVFLFFQRNYLFRVLLFL